MEDIMHDARVFETNIKLQAVAEALEDFARTGSLPAESDAITWTASIIDQLDSTAGGISAGLAEQAANVRPSIYAALANESDELRKSGITDIDQVQSFLKNLHTFLISRTQGLSANQAFLASRVLRAIAEHFLVSLTHNGTPPRQVLTELSHTAFSY